VTGRLPGKVCVVTGGASGIGAGTVRRMVAEGAKVVVADVQDERGAALVAELGADTVFAHCDVAVEADVAGAVDLAVQQWGRLDVMFNNAGILGAVGSIAKTNMDDVDRTFDVILRGAFLGMKHAARVMIPQGSGSIISTTSPGGLRGGIGPHAYSGAKAGVIGLTQSVAAELRYHQVRCNALAPGAVVSAMTADLVTGDASDEAGALAALAAPNDVAGRPGLPADVAAAVVFLASDESVFVTGSTMLVDGGVSYADGPAAMATGDFDEPAGIHEAGRRS
jgi:NAD(P)-dependent dehydrogenase (short-subunit alcohol dehydrogenase family)